MPTDSPRTQSQNRQNLQIPMFAPEANESCRVDAGGVRRVDSGSSVFDQAIVWEEIHFLLHLPRGEPGERF